MWVDFRCMVYQKLFDLETELIGHYTERYVQLGNSGVPFYLKRTHSGIRTHNIEFNTHVCMCAVYELYHWPG